jgi:phospholipid/cholesterol/gamma-HCH transport system substrate-binding protein
MANTSTETIIGAAVLAVAVGFATYLMRAESVSAPSGAHELHASFRSAEGVSVGTDVRLAGVKIGTVTGVSLDRTTYRADVRFTVPTDLELASDTQALVSTEGLLGGTYLEIVPGGAPDNLEAGSEVVETQGAISVVTLLMKFVGGSDE